MGKNMNLNDSVDTNSSLNMKNLADEENHSAHDPISKDHYFKFKGLGDGRTVYISTYGCQMNVNDTERMLSLLEMANFTSVEKPELA